MPTAARWRAASWQHSLLDALVLGARAPSGPELRLRPYRRSRRQRSSRCASARAGCASSATTCSCRRAPSRNWGRQSLPFRAASGALQARCSFDGEGGEEAGGRCGAGPGEFLSWGRAFALSARAAVLTLLPPSAPSLPNPSLPNPEQVGGSPHSMLLTQYRMRPSIALFPSRAFYGERLVNGRSVLDRVDPASLGPLQYYDEVLRLHQPPPLRCTVRYCTDPAARTRRRITLHAGAPARLFGCLSRVALRCADQERRGAEPRGHPRARGRAPAEPPG